MPTLPTSQSYVIAVLVLSIAICLSAAALLLSRPEPITITIHPPQPTSTPLPTATPAPVNVYVTGAVAKPDQVHRLPHGSRVADAIEAAGGLTENADKTRVNMAAFLRDGDQVHAPLADAAENAAELPTPSGGNPVYLNTATQSELETLPGIGPETALRIIEYRELIGDFDNLSDLDKVPGIGPATLEKLADLVAFD